MSSSVDDTGLQFIHGRRRRGGSSDPLTVTNPASAEVVATDTLASVDDVREAVAAARAALPGWAGATPRGAIDRDAPACGRARRGRR